LFEQFLKSLVFNLLFLLVGEGWIRWHRHKRKRLEFEHERLVERLEFVESLFRLHQQIQAAALADVDLKYVVLRRR